MTGGNRYFISSSASRAESRSLSRGTRRRPRGEGAKQSWAEVTRWETKQKKKEEIWQSMTEGACLLSSSSPAVYFLDLSAAPVPPSAQVKRVASMWLAFIRPAWALKTTGPRGRDIADVATDLSLGCWNARSASRARSEPSPKLFK